MELTKVTSRQICQRVKENSTSKQPPQAGPSNAEGKDPTDEPRPESGPKTAQAKPSSSQGDQSAGDKSVQAKKPSNKVSSTRRLRHPVALSFMLSAVSPEPRGAWFGFSQLWTVDWHSCHLRWANVEGTTPADRSVAPYVTDRMPMRCDALSQERLQNMQAAMAAATGGHGHASERALPTPT
eukprot:9075408-Pyramimonas_sp.AAC.1